VAFETWLTFAAASLVVLAMPGPTVLMVLSYALSQGRCVALASVAGVALGDFLAMSASLIGLGALIATSATAFTILKWIGALYLIWMGLNMLRAAGTSGRKGALNPPRTPGPISPGAVFRATALVTALNPKPIAFFIAFVPQLVRPEAPLAPQFAILIATFVGLGALNALAYALSAGALRGWLNRPAASLWLNRTAASLWLSRLGGVTLIAMGAMTATLRRTTP